MRNVLTWAGLAIATAILGGVLTAIPVWFLWNAVVPVLFGLKEISLVQALLLSLLCSLLFKSSSSSSSSS